MSQSTGPTLITDGLDPRRAEHARELQEIQKQIGALKFQYGDNTLAFKALDCAWEAARLDGTSLVRCQKQRVMVVPSWYAVTQEAPEHLDNLEASLDWIRNSARQKGDVL